MGFCHGDGGTQSKASHDDSWGQAGAQMGMLMNNENVFAPCGVHALPASRGGLVRPTCPSPADQSPNQAVSNRPATDRSREGKKETEEYDTTVELMDELLISPISYQSTLTLEEQSDRASSPAPGHPKTNQSTGCLCSERSKHLLCSEANCINDAYFGTGLTFGTDFKVLPQPCAGETACTVLTPRAGISDAYLDIDLVFGTGSGDNSPSSDTDSMSEYSDGCPLNDESDQEVEYVCPIDGDDDDGNDDGSGSDDVPFTLNEWKNVQSKGRKLQSAPSSPPGLASSPWSARTTTVEHRNPFEALVTKDDQTDDDAPLFGPRRTQTVDVATTPLTERNISVMAMTPPKDDPWSATGSDPWSPGTSNDMVQEDAGPVHVHRARNQSRDDKEVIWREDGQGATDSSDYINEFKRKMALLQESASLEDKKAKFEGQALAVARQIFEQHDPKKLEEGKLVRPQDGNLDPDSHQVGAGSSTPMSEKLNESVDLLDLEHPTTGDNTKQQRLQMILQVVSQAFWLADADGERLEISVSRSCREDKAFEQVDGVLECLKEGMLTKQDVIIAAKGGPPPGYKRLKNGITMDSGSNVDILPSNELPQFAVTAPTGNRRGKRLAAANGTAIQVDGEQKVQFTVKEGHDLEWPFLVGDVKKALKSVGTTCDAGNYVLYTEWGGYIINAKLHQHIEFDRVNNTYAIDAFVRAVARPKGFQMQAAAP